MQTRNKTTEMESTHASEIAHVEILLHDEVLPKDRKNQRKYQRLHPKKNISKTELPCVTIRKITQQNGGTGGVKTKGLA